MGFNSGFKGLSLTSANHTEITNKMQSCTRIYYSIVYQLLNMFRVTHQSSSGAQNCNCSLWFYIRHM